MPETPRTDRRPVSRSMIVRITLLSACVAATVAWWAVIRPLGDPAADTPSVDSSAQTTGDTAVVGQPAPAITLPGLDGADVRLADRRGKVIVVNFWASTCAPCIKEMPLLERAAAERPDVSFVGVSVSESIDAGLDMVERTGVTFDQTRDPTGEQLAAFGGIALPHTVVIDADGNVAALANRALRDAADLDELIARAT